MLSSINSFFSAEQEKYSYLYFIERKETSIDVTCIVINYSIVLQINIFQVGNKILIDNIADHQLFVSLQLSWCL